MSNSLNDSKAVSLAEKIISCTNKLIFLTGKAGTGKTTFLKKLVQNTYKKTVIVAPTGIAAINANGVTIHSFFGIPFGSFIPDSSYQITDTSVKLNTAYTLAKHLKMREEKRKLMQELELLVIDEVSMLRADLLDTIDFVLRTIRRQQHLPFGGVQVLFIGDLMQLPPVVKAQEWDVLKHFYNSIYFFDAKVLNNQQPLYIQLDKIYRQDDERFIELLNNLRDNKVLPKDLDLLNACYDPKLDLKNQLNTITLTTHNYLADDKNRMALNSLKEPSVFYEAVVTGEFSESSFPVDHSLELRKGAQIMFIKNDISGKQLFFNGKLATVIELKPKEITVDFNDGSKPIQVEKYTWRNIKYELNKVTNEIEEVEVGQFIQFPIKLAWAITVHKSQGLTFEKAILDINNVFAPGQLYVALSRLKSLKGLRLSAPVQFNNIIQDKNLLDYNNSRLRDNDLEAVIDKAFESYLRDLILKAFDFTWLNQNSLKFIDTYKPSKNAINFAEHNWINHFLEKIVSLNEQGVKFLQQLQSIFNQKNEGYFVHVLQRVKSAESYFQPLFGKLSEALLTHVTRNSSSKKNEVFQEEIIELENLFFKQQQLIAKSVFVFEKLLYHQKVDKHLLQTKINFTDRIELLKQKVLNNENQPSGSISKKRKKSLERPEKRDTKELSRELYLSGKNIEEVARERKMTIDTIESHLIYYVALGELQVLDFVSEKKFKKIVETEEEHHYTKLKDYKELLGDDYSYKDLKFSLAAIEFLKKF